MCLYYVSIEDCLNKISKVESQDEEFVLKINICLVD